MDLRRYWYSFEADSLGGFSPLRLGCGITAFNRVDADAILRLVALKEDNVPVVSGVIEDVDISSLDGGHVVPNMGSCAVRGVWFPQGYYISDGEWFTRC